MRQDPVDLATRACSGGGAQVGRQPRDFLGEDTAEAPRLAAEAEHVDAPHRVGVYLRVGLRRAAAGQALSHASVARPALLWRQRDRRHLAKRVRVSDLHRVGRVARGLSFVLSFRVRRASVTATPFCGWRSATQCSRELSAERLRLVGWRLFVNRAGGRGGPSPRPSAACARRAPRTRHSHIWDGRGPRWSIFFKTGANDSTIIEDTIN